MKTENTPPQKKPRKKAAESESIAGKHPTRTTDGNEANGEKPSEEELISHWRNPVTNQDGQEKITNSEGDDIPLTNE